MEKASLYFKNNALKIFFPVDCVEEYLMLIHRWAVNFNTGGLGVSNAPSRTRGWYIFLIFWLLSFLHEMYLAAKYEREYILNRFPKHDLLFSLVDCHQMRHLKGKFSIFFRYFFKFVFLLISQYSCFIN